MRKVYRDAIISGVAVGIIGGVGSTITIYLIQGKVPWTFLIAFPIFVPIGHLIRANLRMRREAKKEEKDQRRE